MLSKKNILYIEDNSDNQIIMEALVRRSLNVDIESVSCAEEGMARCQQQLPNIILMDIRLPGMDGVEAIRQLKRDSRTRDIPVIAVSADAMDAVVQKALQAGAEKYITKPFEISEVVSAIKYHLPDSYL
ncbi:MAG: response regulator [Gammaproteobacteria bacterium]|nr:response regulator [Gammaproteobacteria bacterium]